MNLHAHQWGLTPISRITNRLQEKSQTNMLSHKQIITRILSGQVKLTAESPFTNKIRNNENEHRNFIQALKNTLIDSNTTDFNRFLQSTSELKRR